MTIESYKRLRDFGKYSSIAALCFAGAVEPSILNGIYFGCFLYFSTWLAFNQELHRRFGIALTVISLILAFHICALILFQLPWFQNLTEEGFWVQRLFSLKAIYKDTKQSNLVFVANMTLDHYLNPLVLVVTYQVITLESRFISVSFFQFKGLFIREIPWFPEGAVQKRRHMKNRKLSENFIYEFITFENHDVFYEHPQWKKPQTSIFHFFSSFFQSSKKLEEKASKYDHDHLALERFGLRLSLNEFARRVIDKFSIGKIKPVNETKKGMNTMSLLTMVHRKLKYFSVRNAYVVANGCMMIWSVVYHSWFGFVLVVWANLIWIRKNQRQQMLNSSIYLVVYALCLLIIDYISEMDFTDKEFPKSIWNINLVQVGLSGTVSYPGIQLLVKSACMVSFWTMNRLMIQEKLKARNRETRNIAENVRMLMEKERRNKSYAKAFYIVEKVFCFSFMWIIAVLLFVMGITGGEMTLFRIINMCFSLSFFLMFHFSLTVWRTTMHTFWWSLIIYSITALIVTYVYQFDNFQNYIFLKKFGTRVLFVKLLTYSLVIFLTGLQINKFQNQFLALFERKSDQISTGDDGQVKMSLSQRNSLKSFFFQKTKAFFKNVFNKVLIAIEIHFFKVFLVLSFWALASQVIRSP